jgi:hypothetical protein
MSGHGSLKSPKPITPPGIDASLELTERRWIGCEAADYEVQPSRKRIDRVTDDEATHEG